MSTAEESIEAALGGARVIAVLSPSTPADAVFAAGALAAGGIQAVEVTFRTVAPEAALAAVAAALPDLAVGAGTIAAPGQVAAARAAGARFVVSPGLDEAVVATARAVGLVPTFIIPCAIRSLFPSPR